MYILSFRNLCIYILFDKLIDLLVTTVYKLQGLLSKNYQESVNPRPAKRLGVVVKGYTLIFEVRKVLGLLPLKGMWCFNQLLVFPGLETVCQLKSYIFSQHVIGNAICVLSVYTSVVGIKLHIWFFVLLGNCLEILWLFDISFYLAVYYLVSEESGEPYTDLQLMCGCWHPSQLSLGCWHTPPFIW